MAISPVELAPFRIPSKMRALSGNDGIKTISFIGDLNSQSSIASSRRSKNKMSTNSPYYTSGSIQLLSRVTEQRILHKKQNGCSKAYPITSTNVYKTHSGELKKNVSKKNKKSVLTLPNTPAPKGQEFIVSDMNESEYFDLENKNSKMKRRTPLSVKKNKQKTTNESSEQLSCMSSRTGSPGRARKNSNSLSNTMGTDKQANLGAPHEVWDVIRRMNKMRFRPSPVISGESVACKKKKKVGKKNNKKDKSFVETFRTEEIAYISSVEYSSKTTTCCSKTISNDRVTVIDKDQEIQDLAEEFENHIANLYKYNEENMKKNTNRQVSKPRAIKRKNDKRKIDRKGSAIKDKKHKKPIEPSKPQKEPSLLTVFKKVTNGNPEFSLDYDDSDKALNIVEEPRYSQLLLQNTSDALVQTPTSIQQSVEIVNGAFAPSVKTSNTNGTKKNTLSSGGKSPVGSPTTLRKPRLVTTMPSSNTLQEKNAGMEIKKKLQNYKFPLTVLGRDQLSSEFHKVSNLPHMDAMEERIWPFMIEWTKPKVAAKKIASPKARKVLSPKPSVLKSPNKVISTFEKQERKQIALENKKKLLSAKNHDRGSMITEEELTEAQQRPQNHTKVTSQISQLTDKMLEFLYRKAPNEIGIGDKVVCGKDDDNYRFNQIHHQSNPNNNVKKDASIDTCIEFNLIPSEMILEHVEEKKIPSTKKSKLEWSKVKWTNELIDSVIKKVQSGAYYNEVRYLDPRQKECSEVSIQTTFTIRPELELNISEEFNLLQCGENNTDESDVVTNIPGFDESMAGVEIEAYSGNQITLKHCHTNIIISFDIAAIPKVTNATIQGKDFITSIAKSAASKMFKYKTTISNTELPAKICSLLPKMVQNILENCESPLLQRVDESITQLSTICEISPPGSVVHEPEIFEPPLPTPVTKLLYGSFSTGARKVTKYQELTRMRTYEFGFIISLLPKLDIERLPKAISLNTTTMKLPVFYESVGTVTDTTSYDVISTCKALQLYTQDSTPAPLNLAFDNLWRARSQTLSHSLHLVPITITYDVFNDQIIVNMFSEERMATMSVRINKNANCDYRFDEYVKNCASSKSLPDSEDSKDDKQAIIKNDKINKHDKIKKYSRCVGNYNTKHNKKCFVKLYRKYKSGISLCNDDHFTTPLKKITSIGDFLNVMGAGKTILSVFDNNTESKILTSLIQMRDWVSRISSQQALLVLLLNNKNESPNLLKLRPMLLQGIAVNRITRANELDMEIEVIEREKIRVSQTTEGITYVPASEENCNHLYDELCWIAKTTASDYHRTFDDSSQKLLKSLLEKRKTLNPSYLRVMARYVGLGLLKSTKRNY